MELPLPKVFQIFIENRFFFHTRHPSHNFPSLHLSPPHCHTSSLLLLLLQKSASLLEMTVKQDKTRYNKKTGQKLSYAPQGHPIGGKESHEQTN